MFKNFSFVIFTGLKYTSLDSKSSSDPLKVSVFSTVTISLRRVFPLTLVSVSSILKSLNTSCLFDTALKSQVFPLKSNSPSTKRKSLNLLTSPEKEEEYKINPHNQNIKNFEVVSGEKAIKIITSFFSAFTTARNLDISRC